MAIAREADMLLLLMRGGAPNNEVLLARSVDDLYGIAKKYSITLPMRRGSEDADEADGDLTAFASEEPSGSSMLSGGSGRDGTYEGQRNERGEWEGHGRYTFADGSVYEGQWRANRQEGWGTFWYASGNLYDGQWKAGKKDGHGMFGYADGRVEVGTYVADQDVGEGAMWSADRRTAWRIVQDGLEVAEVTLTEAKAIAERCNETVPSYGDWLGARVAARNAEQVE